MVSLRTGSYRTVGDGQHGTARWATDKEIRQTYAHVPFKVRDWRKGVCLPAEQGLVQDLLEPARGARGRSRFQLLMDKLPSEHKAR